jgi:serine/threonine-protein kinase HipA
MTSGSDTLAAINIYARDQKVGTLTFTEINQCELKYDSSWIEQGFPLSPALPLSGEFEAHAAINFLKNLFPEGEGLDELLQSQRISKSNLLSVLTTIGHDTAGALTFSKQKPSVDSNSIRKIDPTELEQRIASQSTRQLVVWDDKYRLSVAGVQNKLNVLIDKTGAMFLGAGQLSSTHILKFSSKESPLIIVNEYFCMKLAGLVGLNVADVKLTQFGKYYALVVRRFDRLYNGGVVRKAHAVDGCQVLNLPPAYKYEQNLGSSRDVKDVRNGASLAGLFAFADQCELPGRTTQAILDWVIFNVLIGNSDAHGKNITFFVSRNAFTLAPFYDLISVVHEAKLNTRLDIGLAMAIGDQFDINNITAYDWLSLADENNIPFKQLKKRMYLICAQTLEALNQSEQISTGFEAEVLESVNNLKSLVHDRCNQFILQCEELDAVSKNAF